jgi:hypothetical protein
MSLDGKRDNHGGCDALAELQVLEPHLKGGAAGEKPSRQFNIGGNEAFEWKRNADRIRIYGPCDGARCWREALWKRHETVPLGAVPSVGGFSSLLSWQP